jgi:tetratricopeptide (TPR) repeat protein
MNSIGLPQRADRAAILAAIFLVTLAVLPYLQTLRYDFVDYDDHLYVIENPHIEHGLNLSSVGWAFTTFRTGNWHPLAWLSHMLDVDLWGAKAGGHHFTSVLLHSGNTLLLFFVLLRMTGSLWRCALVSALFAVHPLHVESVAWISERKDVLSTFFGLLALWAYLAYARSGSTRKYLLMIGFFVLSLMAKPMLVTFPFLLLLLDLWPLRRWKLWTIESQMVSSLEPQPFRRVLLEKVPLFVIAALFSIVAIISQHEGQSIVGLDDIPLGSRLGNTVVGYTFYLSKLLAPLKLTFFYPHPEYWPLSDVALSALFLLIVTVATIVYRRQHPWLLIGWLWFVGTLVPVIGLVQIGWQAMADRYTYVPSVGVFIMIVWSIPAALPSRFPRTSMAAAAVFIALFAAKTWRQVSYWKDSRTLFTHAAQATRGNFLAHQYLGNRLEKEEDYMGALKLYRVAAAERPAYAKINIHENIANILIRQGRYTEAMSELKSAIEINPKSSVAYNSMGSVMTAWNENDQAATYFRRAVELDPKNTAAHINYGMASVTLGRWDEAIAQLSPVVRAEPKRLVARTNLALALANRGDPGQAIEELRQVLQIDPKFAAAQEALQKIEAQVTASPAPASDK